MSSSLSVSNMVLVLALQGTSEELVARQIFGRGNDAHFDILVT
jgi:hypothetical protein